MGIDQDNMFFGTSARETARDEPVTVESLIRVARELKESDPYYKKIKEKGFDPDNGAKIYYPPSMSDYFGHSPYVRQTEIVSEPIVAAHPTWIASMLTPEQLKTLTELAIENIPTAAKEGGGEGKEER